MGSLAYRLDRVNPGVRSTGVLSYWLPDSERFIAEKVARRDELFSQFAVFVVFLAFYSITAGSDTNPFNAHVRQAVAFVHGHTLIDAPNYIEHAQIGALPLTAAFDSALACDTADAVRGDLGTGH